MARFGLKVVKDVEAKTLMPLISHRVKPGSTICSDTWKSYTGIAAKGYVHRLVEHQKGEYSDKHGNHINGFKRFLKDILKDAWPIKVEFAKKNCPLYLAEYVGRYNHRHFSIKQQTNKILQLLFNYTFDKI